MLPRNRTATHPGEILRHEFLEPLDMTQTALATHIGVKPGLINEVVNGRRGISPRMAQLLSMAFGVSPMFWMNLQSAHDITRHRVRKKVARIATPA